MTAAAAPTAAAPRRAKDCPHELDISPSGRLCQCRLCGRVGKWRDGMWEWIIAADVAHATYDAGARRLWRIIVRLMGGRFASVASLASAAGVHAGDLIFRLERLEADDAEGLDARMMIWVLGAFDDARSVTRGEKTEFFEALYEAGRNQRRRDSSAEGA